MASAADEKDQVVLKKALQKFNDFIGNYKAAGGPAKTAAPPSENDVATEDEVATDDEENPLED